MNVVTVEHGNPRAESPAPDTGEPNDPGILRKMPQLDALRGIAVALVLVQHLLMLPLHAQLPWGRLGVRMFFVLSGFLITGILLKCRSLTESGNQTPGFTLRQFYIRRFLRLMPAYYLILLIAALAGVRAIREPLLWHLSYLSNVYEGRTGQMNMPAVHLWSLAVEEQFYLVWPFMVLFVPRRWLAGLVAVGLATGPAYRVVTQTLFHWKGPAVGLQTPACLDTLALGALLAMLSQPGAGPRAAAWREWLCRVGLWIGLPALVLTCVLQNTKHLPGSADAYLDLVYGLVGVWLVGRAATGFSGAGGAILDSSPLRYLGRISYGIYLYHPFVLWVAFGIARRVGLLDPLMNHPWIEFGILCLISVAVAAASWHFFEAPVSRLKRFAQYVRSPRPEALRNPPPVVQVGTNAIADVVL